MSRFGPEFDRAARAYDAQIPDGDDYPAALDDALPCPCSPDGQAIWLPAGRKADTASLQCSNTPRCGRLIPILEGRTVADAVELWNDEIREESCIKHSWIRQPSDGPACKPLFACIHCGKVMEQ